MVEMGRSSRSNNTNKLSPQEPDAVATSDTSSSNNTNKLSPQEHVSPLVFLGYEFK